MRSETKGKTAQPPLDKGETQTHSEKELATGLQERRLPAAVLAQGAVREEETAGALQKRVWSDCFEGKVA